MNQPHPIKIMVAGSSQVESNIVIAAIKYKVTTEYASNVIEISIENTITKQIYAKRFDSASIAAIMTEVGIQIKTGEFYGILIEAIKTSDETADILHKGMESAENKLFTLEISWKLNASGVKIVKKFVLLLEQVVQEPHDIMGKIMGDFVAQKTAFDAKIEEIISRQDEEQVPELDDGEFDKLKENVAEISMKLNAEIDRVYKSINLKCDSKFTDAFTEIGECSKRISDLSNRFDKKTDDSNAAFDKKITDLTATFNKKIADLTATSDKKIADLTTAFDKKIAESKVAPK